MDKIGIILVNYRQWSDTIECLDSLLRLDKQPDLTVIVDNNSENESVLRIAEWLKNNPAFNGVLLEAECNHGFAAGNNIGINFLLERNIRYFWLLNNDTVVDSKALTYLCDKIKEDDNIGFVGSKLLLYNRHNTIQAAGGAEYFPFIGYSRHFGEGEVDRGQWDRNLEPYYVNGASLLVSRQVLEDVGLMNEQFFMYGEEVEWQIRAKLQGWKTAYACNSKVYHKVSASIKGINKKYFAYYYIVRNAVITNRKYYPAYIVSLLGFNLIKAFGKLFTGEVVVFRAIVKGIVDGFKIDLKQFFFDYGIPVRRNPL